MSRESGTILLVKNYSNYLDVKLKVFKKDDNKDFRLFDSLTMGKADFNQFLKLRYQLVVTAENFVREENLPPVLVPTMSKGMNEQLNIAHKVVDVVDRAKKDLYASGVVQGGQAREFICSSPFICIEDRGDVSTICLCEIDIRRICLCT